MFTREYGKEKMEEIFWDEVGGGRSYDGAIEEASNWAGNNRIEGVDYDDEDAIEKLNDYLYSGIPPYLEFLRMKKTRDDENTAQEKANEEEQRAWEKEIVEKNPNFPYTKESYDAALERWHADGFREPMSYYDFIEFMTEYLD